MFSYKPQIISRSLTVAIPPATAYKIIMATENYPHFIPWCKKVTILDSEPREIHAKVNIDFNGISTYYDCIVKHSHILNEISDKEKEFWIEISSESGVFQNLSSKWEIAKAGEDSALIHFEISLLFKSRIFNMMAGKLIEAKADKIVEMFRKRIKDYH